MLLSIIPKTSHLDECETLMINLPTMAETDPMFSPSSESIHMAKISCE